MTVTPTNLPSVVEGQTERIEDTNDAWEAINALTAVDGVVLQGQTSAVNNLYVSTTGSNSNDGLTVGTPFLTIQKAFDYLQTRGPILQGTWFVNLAAGTYTAVHDQLHTTPSMDWVTVRGPAVSGGVPTAILNGSGGGNYVHGIRCRGVGVKLKLMDLKAINYTGDALAATRVSFLGESGAALWANNCHAVGSTWAGVYFERTAKSYLDGGIYDGCRYGIETNFTELTARTTTVQNCTSAGVHWSRGTQGHLDDSFLTSNAIGLLIAENARVDTITDTFTSNAIAIKATSGGQFGEGGSSANVFTTNTVNFDFRAYAGDWNEMEVSSSEIRVGYDGTSHGPHTGTLTQTTLANALYTIPANRLAGADKQCRVVVSGVWTAATAGAILTIEIGGSVLNLAVVSAATNAVFEAEVKLLRVNNAWRSIGKMMVSAQSVRTGSTAAGFTQTSAQAVSVKATLANVADSVTIYRTDVYITG